MAETDMQPGGPVTDPADKPEATDAPGPELRAELAGRSRERHPSPKEYVRIALILGAITALEVAIYYAEAIRSLLIPLLFLFSAIKFSLVVLWFMHLKFDNRLYARLFVTGILFAATVYLIVLLTFRVFAS